jgi:hypothetical protein
MRTLLVVMALLVAAPAVAKPAVAKPLPGGMKVITKLGRPYVQQGKVTVALRDDDVADYEKITRAELEADGKTVAVTSTRCKGASTDEITRVPLAKIQARFDNALGLVAQGKKKYADAIKSFTTATAKDPETWGYGTNLMSAQLLANKADALSQTIAVQGRKNPVWLTWRVATDAELAPIASHKRFKELDATTRGTATAAKLGEHDIATSPGAIAAMRTLAIGSPGTTEVDFVSLVSGKLLARMPITALEDACDQTAENPCDDAAKARIAERTRVIDEVLGKLGFTIQPNALVDVRNGDDVNKDGVVVETSDDTLKATKGSDERSLAVEGNVWSVAITPKAVIAKLNRRNLYGCEDGSSRFVAIALPLP